MSGTTYTPSLRFAIMTPGDPAVRNQWGTILDNFITVNEQAITGNAAIALSGTAVTLTANNNASDQSRQAVYNFTGALVSACTVTMPAEPKVGWAQNNTTGGQNIILTTGSGTTLTIAPGLTYFYDCDGTNVASVTLGAVGLDTTGNIAASGDLFVTGNVTTRESLSFTGLQASASYANDAAAAAGGVSVGQLYRNGSVVQIRVT